VVVTTLMASASVSIAACDTAPDTPAWQGGNTPVARDQGEQVEAFAYRTLEGCKKADEIPDDQCDAGWKQAQADHDKSGPRYDQQATCEEVYGQGQCVPRSASGGGSVWGPLLTGFVVGQMLNGGWGGSGLYRDRYGGGYHTPWGGRLSTDYNTGRAQIGRYGIDPPDAVRQAPPRVQTRSSVISRGGFGGRMATASSSSRGGWGG